MFSGQRGGHGLVGPALDELPPDQADLAPALPTPGGRTTHQPTIACLQLVKLLPLCRPQVVALLTNLQ